MTHKNLLWITLFIVLSSSVLASYPPIDYSEKVLMRFNTGDGVYNNTFAENLGTQANFTGTGSIVYNNSCGLDGGCYIGTGYLYSSSNFRTVSDDGTKVSAFAWMKHNSSAYGMILTHYDTSNRRGWSIETLSTGTMQILLSTAGTGVTKSYRTNFSINDNNWHHVGFVFGNQSGELDLYFNGQIVTNLTKTTDNAMTTIFNPNWPVGINARGNAGSWAGTTTINIDDVYINNISLNYTQVKYLYDNGLYPTSPSYLGLSFVNPTPDNETSLEQSYIPVNLSVNSSSDFYSLLDFDRDLVGWWRFEEASWSGTSGEIKDSGSYSFNGTSTNGNTQSTGVFGRSGNLSGTTDYLNVPHNESLDINTSFSISVWLKPDSNPTYGTISAKGNADGSFQHYFITQSGRVRLSFPTWNGIERGTSTLSTGVWSHVVAVYNGSHVNYYLNGAEDGSIATGNVPVLNSRDLRFGMNERWGEYFRGSMDEYLYFNRALSLVEVKSLFNATANQYYNNFTGLSVGDYSFTGYAVNKDNMVNSTSRNVSLIISNPCLCVLSGSGNWNINLSDNCVINTPCDVSFGELKFSGTGNFTVNTTIGNVSRITGLGIGSVIWMKPNAKIYMRTT